jgi:hypothetical protein
MCTNSLLALAAVILEEPMRQISGEFAAIIKARHLVLAS